MQHLHNHSISSQQGGLYERRHDILDRVVNNSQHLVDAERDAAVSEQSHDRVKVHAAHKPVATRVDRSKRFVHRLVPKHVPGRHQA